MLEYGNQGNQGWGFDALYSPDADDAAGRLMNNVDHEDGDADSTVAEADHGPYELDAHMSDGGSPWEDAQEFSGMDAGRGTPVNSSPYDDHAIYSEAHEQQFDDVLHLENAGMTGKEDEETPVEIYPDPPTPNRMQEDENIFADSPA
jgi:hypothetical protein